MLIFIVSLLFILQSTIIFGIAEVNNLPSNTDSKDTDNYGAETEDDSSDDSLDGGNSDMLQDNDGYDIDPNTPTNNIQTTPITTVITLPSDSENNDIDDDLSPDPTSKEQLYATALANINYEKKLFIDCPDEVLSGSEFKVLVTSEGDSIAGATILFMAEEFLTNNDGTLILEAPTVKEGTKIPITARKEGYISYSKYIGIKIDNVEDTPNCSQDMAEFDLLRFLFQKLFPLNLR